MKNFLALMLVLAFSVTANAQYFDMQRSPNIGTESNPIRPEITNDLSHLGAAYTLGTETGNLTGNYGNTFEFRLFRAANDIGLRMTFRDKDGNVVEQSTGMLGWGISITMGQQSDLGLIISGDKLFYKLALGTVIDEKHVKDVDVFGMLGGYIDYVAISGSGAVGIYGFQCGNGWIGDSDNYGYTNMETIRGQGISVSGNVSFYNNSVTFTSKALAWNTETGTAMNGRWQADGIFMPEWNNLTFTFGSFERVPAPAEVPEPGTLLMLGVAAVGLSVVRRWCKR